MASTFLLALSGFGLKIMLSELGSLFFSSLGEFVEYLDCLIELTSKSLRSWNFVKGNLFYYCLNLFNGYKNT